MQFKIITKEEFLKYHGDFNYNFYQNPLWGEVKKENGWGSFYTAVLDKKNKPLLISLVLSKKILGKYLYYAPRGPLLKDEANRKEVYTFYLIEIKKYLKTKNAILFKFDPLIEYTKHDKEGKAITEDTEQDFVDFLKKNDVKHRGFTIGYTDEAQFRWSYALDIKSKTFDDLTKDMNSRCKRSIKKAEKYPLKIKDVTDETIKDFKDIMESTAERQHHGDRTLSYYQTLKDKLKDIIRMCLVYLDKEKFLDDIDNGKYTIDEKVLAIVKNDERDMIPISAGIFIFDKDRFNYVYGGTYAEYFPFMAPYKLQEEMIKYAIEKKMNYYDFGGISGNFTPGTPEYGVYEYKRGYGGFVIEYIGEFDLIINKPYYLAYKYGLELYRTFRKIVYKIKKN